MFTSLFAIVALASAALAADRLDELFAIWEKAQAGVQSLVVEFTVETNDRVTDQPDKTTGTFRLIRMPNGEICACCEFGPVEKAGGKLGRQNYLLNNRSVYIMDYDKKQAVHFGVVDGNLQPFLEKWFNPYVVLLNRNRADAKYNLEIVKPDEWYTYLLVRPKGEFVRQAAFRQGRIVLLNKATATAPKDMPRQLITDTATGSRTTIDIKSWRLNAPDGPKAEEFTKPENRPGWEALGQPILQPKK